MRSFIGRHSELLELNRQAKKKIASLIIVKGRRRIGKSRLIAEFCKNYKHYNFMGLVPTAKTTKQSEIDEFANQLGNNFGIPGIKADDINSR